MSTSLYPTTHTQGTHLREISCSTPLLIIRSQLLQTCFSVILSCQPADCALTSSCMARLPVVPSVCIARLPVVPPVCIVGMLVVPGIPCLKVVLSVVPPLLWMARLPVVPPVCVVGLPVVARVLYEWTAWRPPCLYVRAVCCALYLYGCAPSSVWPGCLTCPCFNGRDAWRAPV